MQPDGRRRVSQVLRSAWFYFLGVLVVYGLLLLPTLGRQGISWDEQNDLWVARAYLERTGGWLAGSDIDPSQTRLPMFTVALVYKLLNTSDLITARLVSGLVGALTLLAIFIFCKQRFDPVRGVLACALLATSPFFLSFARVAFTETDVYLACTLTWLLVCVTRLQDRPTIGRAAVTGLVLGLAISAKATALAVLPAVWWAVAQSPARGRDLGLSREKARILYLWTAWSFICALAGWYLAAQLASATDAGDEKLFHYLLVLGGGLLPLAWSVQHRKLTSSSPALGAFIPGLALLTALVLPPEHLTNPAILRSLAARFYGEMSFRPGFIFEVAGLHIFSILFKSSPVIGAGMILGTVMTAWQWRRQEIRFPLLVVLLYFGGLVALPIAQTFYTVPLLPMLALFTADHTLRLFSLRRMVAVGLAVMAAVSLAVDLSLCYPDYNLNGYQWLGARLIAGRPSIGYRSVVQTPSDGVQQAMEWLNDHARPGERVLAYLLPWHIVHAVAPHPVYRLENGLQNARLSSPEYVVVEINAQIPQEWWAQAPSRRIFKPPYDPAWLAVHYNQVFSVPRAFGIEMASVWRKK